MLKRIIVMLLSVVLCFCCSITVFADEEKTEPVTENITEEVTKEETTEEVIEVETEVETTEPTEESTEEIYIEKINSNVEYQNTIILLMLVVLVSILCVKLLR